MLIKFSGFCSRVKIKDGQISYCYGDDDYYYIIGEKKHISLFLDFIINILPVMQADHSIEIIENDGFYYVYFVGLAEFETDQDIEFQACNVTLDYICWEKL